MPPAWERLDDFLSPNDFGDLVTFTPAGGVARAPIAAIFDEPTWNAEAGEYDFVGGEPRLTCKASDVVGLKKHDGATIASAPGVAYALAHDPHPDGTGMAVVILARDP